VAVGGVDRWQAVQVRLREFWQLVDEVFGRVHGRALTNDLVLTALDGRTAVAALEDGDEPRTVWHALCDAMDVSDALRFGASHRQAPPRR
jgi:hypothetical protein